MERIKKIEVTATVFEAPADFDAGARLASTFGLILDDEIEVTIRFSAAQAPYIEERQWAVNQKLTREKDGSLLLWMRTSGWYDVKRWVLSLGPEAEIVEPAALRAEIKQEIAAMLARY